MQSIQQMLKIIGEQSQAAVLAMIVNVEGSSYRKEGAWMLIQENGNRTGVVSGGCLESDLATRASHLFHTGMAELVDYDLSSEDDLGWGRGVGCNGIVTILIRDIDEDFRSFLGFVHQQLLAKEPVYFLQSMTDFNRYMGSTQGGKRMVSRQLDIQLDWDLERPFQGKIGQLAIQKESFHSQIIWPQPHLYIIGAGVDAQPLAQLAAQVGYAVHLYDWRSSICNETHFPTAASIQVGNLEKLIDTVPFTPLDSVVVMTHDFQSDAALVKKLLTKELLYFGILGSKKRSLRLFGGDIPNEVYTPVGLSIGADGSEEIAVSIVAELIAVRQGKRL